MHISFLDPYQPRPSLIHRLDARVKLVLALAFILATALAPPGAWPIYVLLFALVFAVEILSELGVGHVLRRALIAVPFALAALPVLFTVPGPALLTLQIGPWNLTITGPGLERFISILLKSWISVQMAIVLAASTAFPDLLMAMRAIRVPRLLVAIFGLMWRYLFVLADEALRLLRARSARSGLSYWPYDSKLATEARRTRSLLVNLRVLRASVVRSSTVPDHDRGAGKFGGTVAWRARVTGGMAGSLFLRSFERSDRIYAAMAARGYDGEVRSFPLPVIAPVSWVVLVGGLSLLGLLTLFGYLFWG
jgi:cobalt/nickel transport system permease protein